MTQIFSQISDQTTEDTEHALLKRENQFHASTLQIKFFQFRRHIVIRITDAIYSHSIGMVDSVEHAALLLTRLSEIASQQADANEKLHGINRSSGDLKALATNSDGADKAADESRLDQAPSPIPSVVTPTMGSPVQSCSSFPVLPSSLQALPPPPRLGVENPSILQPLQYKLRSKKYTPQTDEIKEVSTPFPETSRSNFVGETTPQKVRGVLKQKFSWKKFPEVRTRHAFLLCWCVHRLTFLLAIHNHNTHRSWKNS